MRKKREKVDIGQGDERPIRPLDEFPVALATAQTPQKNP